MGHGWEELAFSYLLQSLDHERTRDHLGIAGIWKLPYNKYVREPCVLVQFVSPEKSVVSQMRKLKFSK